MMKMITMPLSWWLWWSSWQFWHWYQDKEKLCCILLNFWVERQLEGSAKYFWKTRAFLSRLSFALKASLGLKFSSATRNIRQVGIFVERHILQVGSSIFVERSHVEIAYCKPLCLFQSITIKSGTIITITILIIITHLMMGMVVGHHHPHHQVGISDWGKYGENGAETANPSFPYRQDTCLESHPRGVGILPDNPKPKIQVLIEFSQVEIPPNREHKLPRQVCKVKHRGPGHHPFGFSSLRGHCWKKDSFLKQLSS